MSNELSRHIGRILMHTLSDFQHRLDRDLRQRGVAGIGSRHRAVFLHLGEMRPCRSVDLAQREGISPQSMMKIVHELEQQGLVKRTPDPSDSRAKLLDFTEKGNNFVQELSRSTEIVWEQYAELVGEENLHQTIQGMQQLLDAIQTPQEN